MKYTPGRNYGCTVARNVERLRAADLHESIPCLAADAFLADGVVPAVKRGGRAWGQKRAARTYAGRPKSSRFFGVVRLRRTGKFRAQLTHKGHRRQVGGFATESEAHHAVERELERRASSKSSIENSQ